MLLNNTNHKSNDKNSYQWAMMYTPNLYQQAFIFYLITLGNEYLSMHSKYFVLKRVSFLLSLIQLYRRIEANKTTENIVCIVS